MFELANHINNLDYPKNDFEWLVINDGSTDNLLDEIEKIRQSFPKINLKLINKPNGGIHTAQNCAVKNAEGEYITRIDSDDYLLPDSLKSKDDALRSVSADKNDLIAGVVGLCLNSKDKSVRGTEFPQDKELSKGYLLRRKGVSGDKNFCIKRSVMIQFLIPEFEDTKWVPEGGYLWLEIDKKFDTLFVNIPMAVCSEPNEQSYLGGLKVKNLSNIMSVYYQSLYMLNNGKGYYNINKLCKAYYNICNSILEAAAFDHSQYNVRKLFKDISGIFDKAILFFLYPIVLFKHTLR